MYIQQLYTSCLSEAAYYIESNGEAAIIDPLRDTAVYSTLAEERKARIRYIFETHFHADFVSGHLDLSKATGAPIIFGPGTETAYPVHVAADGEVFQLGRIQIIALHTPGHTPESTCYLLRDETGRDHALFTGDTLFVGDVGRPDLTAGNMDIAEMAGTLYDSLHQKILTLDDAVLIYPAHGAGSSCGKKIGEATFSTLGEQKKSNYALLQPTREAFVQAVTEGLGEAPAYFALNAEMNKKGYESMDNLLKDALRPLTVEVCRALLETDITVLDTRSADHFADGFIPGSIFIGLEGRFAEWAATLLPFHRPILLVTDPGREEEAVTRLARVGFTRFAGFLQGGFESWKAAGEATDMLINVEADELAMDLPFDPNLLPLDVRRITEYADGHVKGALNLPLADFTDPALIAGLEEERNLYIYCAGGYRSVIACSLLKREGIHHLRNVTGGWSKIKEESRIPVEKDHSVLN